MATEQNIRSADSQNELRKTDSKCPIPTNTCAHKIFEGPSKTCPHSTRFHCNPCFCCCCFGGFCNLRKNGILVAALEIIGGIFLSITASALYVHFGGLGDRVTGNGVQAAEYRNAYMLWKSAAMSLVSVGVCGILGGSALLYAAFTRCMPGCYSNILLEVVAIFSCWFGVIFVFLALKTVWKIFQNALTPEEALQLYDEQLYGLLGAILTATAATMVLLYFVACTIGLVLQMRAGVENNPFYCTYFGSTVYLTTCTQCYEETLPNKSCWSCREGGAEDSYRKVVPREVEFVDDGPSTEQFVFPPSIPVAESGPDNVEQQRKTSDASASEKQRKTSNGSAVDRQQDGICEVNSNTDQRRKTSGARKPPTGRKFEWPEGCSVCDFRRLPKNRNSI